MVMFIKQEAQEKANEISVSVEEVSLFLLTDFDVHDMVFRDLLID